MQYNYNLFISIIIISFLSHIYLITKKNHILLYFLLFVTLFLLVKLILVFYKIINFTYLLLILCIQFILKLEEQYINTFIIYERFKLLLHPI